MKIRILGLLLAVLSWVFPAFAANSQTAVDKTMVQTEPTVIDHPGLDVLSFLVGRWEGTHGATKVEEVWTPVSSGSMIGLRKDTKDGKIETQVTIMEEGKFGAFGKNRSFDCYFMNKKTADHPRSVVLNEYSTGSAKLQFVNNDQVKETFSYKLLGKDRLSISTLSGETVTLTKAGM